MDRKRKSDHYRSVYDTYYDSTSEEEDEQRDYDYDQADHNGDWNTSSPPKREQLDDDDLSQQDYGYCPPAPPNQVQREQGHHSS